MVPTPSADLRASDPRTVPPVAAAGRRAPSAGWSRRLDHPWPTLASVTSVRTQSRQESRQPVPARQLTVDSCQLSVSCPGNCQLTTDNRQLTTSLEPSGARFRTRRSPRLHRKPHLPAKPGCVWRSPRHVGLPADRVAGFGRRGPGRGPSTACPRSSPGESSNAPLRRRSSRRRARPTPASPTPGPRPAHPLPAPLTGRSGPGVRRAGLLGLRSTDLPSGGPTTHPDDPRPTMPRPAGRGSGSPLPRGP